MDEQTNIDLADYEPLITSILRSKLHVSLDRTDGRRENQDALELLNDVHVKLLQDLTRRRRSGQPIANLRSYTSVVTYNVYHDYLRKKYPRRFSLKTGLQYFFNRLSGFATWEGELGDVLCGYSAWKGSVSKGPALQLQQIRDEPGLIGELFRAKPLDRMRRDDWQKALRAVFDRVNNSVEIDELVSLIADVAGLREGPPSPPPGPEPPPLIPMKELLTALWSGICELPRDRRIAYLLNFTDCDGDLVIFPIYRVATIEEIGRAVNLSGAELDCLLRAAGVPDCRFPNPDEGFALLWNVLPLPDTAIADIFGITRQRVAKLRWEARERLKDRLRQAGFGPVSVR